MPISHRVDTDLGILIVTRIGRVTEEEEDESFRARTEDPDVVQGIPVLVDSCLVEPADSCEVIRHVAAIATHNAARLRCGRTALLVGSDVSYGMARMYQALTEPTHPDTKVFRDRAKALAWVRGTPRKPKARRGL